MNRTAAPYRVGHILDRMLSADKDLRYMAVSDLMNEMERGEIKLDEDGEKKVVRNLLRLLADKNSEVQNMVIKSLAFLTPILDIHQVNVLIQQLFNTLNDNKPNEVAATALKTIVAQLNPMKSSHAMTLAKDAFPKAVDLSALCHESVLDALDIVSDLLLRFGGNLSSHHLHAHNVLTELMRNQKGLIRKKATQAMGNLSTCCKEDLYKTTVKNLIQWIKAEKPDSAIMRSFIVGVQLLAKGNSLLFAEHLTEILPVLKTVLDNTDEDETREAIIQTYDTLYYRCPQQMLNHRTEIQKTLLNYISYDPNYDYGEDGDIDMDENEYEDDSDNQYSDTDDDISWKVRRASAKTIQAQVKHNRTPECIIAALTEVAPPIIERFKERDQHVLVEVLSTFTSVVHQIKLFAPILTNDMVLKPDMYNTDDVVIGDSHFPASAFSDEQARTLAKFNELFPAFLKATNKLKEKIQSLSRGAFFEMLTELASTIPNILAGQQDLIFTAVQSGLKDNQVGAQNKMNALNFFSVCMERHDPLEFKSHLKNWQDVLLLSVNETFFRVVAETLVVMGQFADVLSASRESSPEALTIGGNLFQCLFEKLSNPKIDTEVLERTILCTGQMFAKLGSDCSPLSSELIEKLAGILEKPACEGSTILATLRALTEICKSPAMNALLQPKASTIMKELAGLISKGNRGIKLAALELALKLLECGLLSGDSESIGTLVEILPKQIIESDLQVTQMALKCLSASIAEGVYNKDEILNHMVSILQSHLLQGATLEAAVDTVRVLASELMKQDPSHFKEFLNQLTRPIYDNPSLHKQAYRSISVAVAEVAAASNDIDQVGNLVEQLISQMNLPASQDHLRLFCIYTIGELGRRFHRVFEGSRFSPEKDLIKAFNMPHEDLRIAAAQSLGALAVGSNTVYLPIILERIASSTDHQYLLLHSLKEVIASKNFANDVYGSIDRIWPVLVSHADCAEEGVRTVVAECLGRICVVSPNNLLPKLQELLSSSVPHVRYCAISAFKFIINGDKKALDDILPEFLPVFLESVKDEDMKVRRIALVVFNAAVHNKTSLVREHITKLIPDIYDDCKVKKELIREVEMGPFKHQVDDGIDVRKAAYECMFTILENCIEKLDIFEFIDKMEEGIKDGNHDIRLLTFMMLIRLSSAVPAQLLSKIDRIAENLRVHLVTKPKPNAVKQEVEKLDELKRGVIRVVRAIQKIPDAERHAQLLELLNVLTYNLELTALCEQVDRDNKGDTAENAEV